MKHIVLGWANDKATGPAQILANTDKPVSEQVKLVTGIKATGVYPDGVVRVAFCEVVERNVGIRIASVEPTKPTEPKKTNKK